MMSIGVRRTMVTVAVLVVGVVAAAWLLATSQARAASSTPVVYVATGENFPDALGAASAAAVQGGPVLLVTRTSIPAVTANELTRLAPDVIYVAGGTAVISDAVLNALKTYAGSVVRVAGSDRYATAAAVSESAFPVTGGGDIAALETAVAALTVRVDGLEANNAALETLLAGVTRNGDTMVFGGMNLQVVNGQGDTATSNGLGNLIIGYNEDADTPETRTGSHYLIIGIEHSYTAHGGIVAGSHHTATGAFASITGGVSNIVSGEYSSVTGGQQNEASGRAAAVSGGWVNFATAPISSVTGGYLNFAAGGGASITGGWSNNVSGDYASVTGGQGNVASGGSASVTGGFLNIASASHSTIVGGDNVLCDSTYVVCGEGFWLAPD